MASKAIVTFNILLIIFAIIIANIIRFRLVPIDQKIKESLPVECIYNFTELTRHFGYVSDEHKVITKDGYILTLFRIVKGRNCKKKKIFPPVILMHGLAQSADAWLAAGPDAGLAFLLSDACYDLWVGNQRGNYYGRQHIRLNPDKDAEFWQFSLDEIGLYDIPATIDYVLQYTGANKVNYVGFSQGSGSFFVMCSERPRYCEKVNILVAVSPASRLTHMKSIPYRTFAQSVRALGPILSATGFHELLPRGTVSQEFLAFFCQPDKMLDVICSTGEAFIDSLHPGSIKNDTIRTLFGHFPAGTSVRTMIRYAQSMTSDKFQKYDYGVRKNLKLYGTSKPPLFNLTAVSVPVMVLYGRNDYLVVPQDINWLVGHLPNVLETVEVKDPLWNHFDVAYSQYTKHLIYPKMNEYLLKYSRK